LKGSDEMNDAEIRAKVDVGDGGSFVRLGKNISRCDKQAEYLKIKINDIKQTLAKADMGFEVGDAVKLEAQLEKLENQYSKLQAKQEETSAGLTKGMEKGIKSIKRFGFALFGIHSIWRMVSRASSAYLQQDTETANRLQAVWVGLGSFLAPILEKISTLVIKAVKYLNVFIKALTGVDLLARAINKSMQKLNNTVKSTTKNLATFDELTNIGDTGGNLPALDWVDAFNNVELNDDIVTWLDNLGAKIKILKDEFDELPPTIKTTLILLGVGGLLSLLIGPSGLVLGFGAVALAINGLIKIFDEDLTTSVEGLMSLLGSAGLVGILVGGSKGLSVAGAIAGVSFALFGLNEYINGDTTQAIEGLILLLGGSGLAGAFIGGTKGLSVGLAIGSVVAILRGFNDLLSGDTTDQIKGFIGLVTGSTGLVVALNLIRGGAKAGLLGILTPLSIMVIGFGALAAGIYAVVTNWSKMTGLERVISVLGILAIAAATAAAAVGALQSAWTLGIAAVAIAAGVAAIAYSISSANKRAQENIPKLAVGTNYVADDGLAYLHKGEAVIPKKFNSQEYFGKIGNEDVLAKLDELIETIEEKDMNAYISSKAIGNVSIAYQNQQKRIMGW
jgi:hypothetical protein